MDNPVPPVPVSRAPVTPNRAIPKVIGILNIVFASGLLLGGLCWAGSIVLQPYTMKMMNEAQKKMEADEKSKHDAALKKLEDQEKEAQTEEEKAEIREARKTAASGPVALKVPMFDLSKLMTNTRVQAWSWADVLTGIVVNVLLLTSGIGLVMFRPWGRKLAVWVASLKVIRLIAVYGYAIFAVVPEFSRLLGKAVGDMMIQQQQVSGKPMPPFMTPDWFTRTYTITYTVMAVGMIVFGAVYPLIMIWLLNRPSARAACGEGKSSRPLEDAW